MDDQNPLNPLLGSIFGNPQGQQAPASEGGQLVAPVIPGVGGEGFKFITPEPIQIPDIKVKAPAQEVRDVCQCGEPGCTIYRKCRMEGMPPGGSTDAWERGDRPAPISAPILDMDQKVLVWKRTSPCSTPFMFAGNNPPMGSCCHDIQVEMSRSEAALGGFKIVGE